MEHGSTLVQPDFVAKRQTNPRNEPRTTVLPAARPKKQPALRDVEISLDAGLFLRATLCCIAVLAALGLLVAYLGYAREENLPELILRAFLLDEEANIPTFFAVSLLVLCSILLALIGARAFLARQAFRFQWALLAALFSLVAFDEAAMLHERLNGPTRGALDASGWMYFAWVIPVGGLVAVLALLYLPFLRGLPAPFGRLFVLSALLYVGGALGVEMPGAAYYEVHGKYNFTYQSITVVEETLEMLGLAFFAYALIRFLAAQHGRVCLDFRAG